MVLKQLGAGPELGHCHATLTIEAFVSQAVTSVGVGGTEVVYSIICSNVNYSKVKYNIYLLLVEKPFQGHLFY